MKFIVTALLAAAALSAQSPVLTGLTTLGGFNVTANQCMQAGATVTGAAVGMAATASPRIAPGTGVWWLARVSAPSVVSVYVCAAQTTFVTSSIYDVAVFTGAPGGLLQTATVTLTAAQINGMFAAPVLIVPAQGAGTVIVPTKLAIDVIAGAAFTGGGNFAVYWTNTSPPGVAATGLQVASILTGLSANTLAFGNGAANPVASSLSVNQGVYLSNVTAPFAGGAGSSMTVTLQYYVLSGVQ